MIKDNEYPNLDPRKFTNDTLDDDIQPDDDEMNELVYELGQPLPAGEDYESFCAWLKKSHPDEDPVTWLRN